MPNLGKLLRDLILIIECPHCFTVVVPTAQGECPACRNIVQDAPEADPSRTSLSVPHLANLPAICCDCGGNTNRYVKVSRKISRNTDGEDPSSALILLLGLLMGGWFSCLLALFRGDSSRIGDMVVVKMPQCDVCRAYGPPDPIRINSEELKMTFVVHKDFKAAVLKESE